MRLVMPQGSAAAMQIDNRSIQAALAKAGHYAGKIDGDYGPASKAARDKALIALQIDISTWTEGRRDTAIVQWTMMRAGIQCTIDGLWGPSSAFALEQWQNKTRSTFPSPDQIAHQSPIWPRQRDMVAFYGQPGTNHTKAELPYPMRLAWDKTKTVNRIAMNAKCAPAFMRALAAAKAHYGYDKLVTMGLDLFGGCYNNRVMRGGTNLSTHAMAAAIDIDPENNQLRWGAGKARMLSAPYSAFIDCFEAEGIISLGRERGFDAMHFQAVRL
jgi:hypothetical protein